MNDDQAILKKRLIDGNRHEYGVTYDEIAFIAPGAVQVASEQRERLLSEFGEAAEIGCDGTKLDMKQLSPGCRICVEGDWSCLFINGRCNARCFYCPSRQDEIGLPTTNAVSFRTPADYIYYLEQFGFRGMSLSGGEPLLTPRRTLSFLAAAKTYFGNRLHTWLYTNGTRVDRDMLVKLRDAGLDEIRFDIGAVNYNLKKLRLAVDLIPTVTVEIPAVPEELPRLKDKLTEMADCGVRHLNLHQLRLTPYSFHHFVGRPYTYLHGEKVTVLESEQTALELLLHARKKNIDLPINYCSFVYKNRYQKAAARRRSALFMGRRGEIVTTSGYLRTLALAGEKSALELAARHLADLRNSEPLWQPHPQGERLIILPEDCASLDFNNLALTVSYSECVIRQSPSCHFPFVELRLPSGRKVAIEKRLAEDVTLHDDKIVSFQQIFLHHRTSVNCVDDPLMRRLHTYECIVEGMQEYF